MTAPLRITRRRSKQTRNTVRRTATAAIDGAIADFTKAIERNPTDPDTLYQWRGEAKRLKHDLDGAIGDYTQAIALQRTNAFYHHYRGEAEERKTDYNGAPQRE